MSEKRFTVDDGLENVLCWEINDKENEDMTCGECAKLLNDLSEENEELKKQLKNCKDARQSYKQDWKACVTYCDTYKNEIHDLEDNLDGLKEENEQLQDALKQRTEQCDKYYEENEKLKKGMIGVVDRYIKNVDCNPPASTHTYMKIKGALLNIREDLRDLLEDLE